MHAFRFEKNYMKWIYYVEWKRKEFVEQDVLSLLESIRLALVKTSDGQIKNLGQSSDRRRASEAKGSNESFNEGQQTDNIPSTYQKGGWLVGFYTTSELVWSLAVWYEVLSHDCGDVSVEISSI